MIEITVKTDYRNLKEGDVYNFSTFPTIVVGKNGCGKSSLSQSIRATKNDWEPSTLQNTEIKGLKECVEVNHSYDLIFEYDSFVDDPLNFQVCYDATNMVTSGGFYMTNKSHGQANQMAFNIFFDNITNTIVKSKTRNVLIILDEIDTGFDFEHIKGFMKTIKKLSKVLDIIIISHNPILMLENKTVYDFEIRKEVSAIEYINSKTNLNLQNGEKVI